MQSGCRVLPLLLVLVPVITGRFIDLTWSHDAVLQSYWPGHTPFSTKVNLAGPFGTVKWVATNDINMAEHSGTHMDAPYHFVKNGRTIEEISWAEMHGPLVVIDIQDKVAQSPLAVVTDEDIKVWEAKHGPVPYGAWVFMRSGWSQYWGDQMKYIGTNETGGGTYDPSVMAWPGFDMSALEYLLENRPGFTGLGSDSCSCEFANTAEFPVHVRLHKANKLCIENLNTNLLHLPESGAEVYALPLKLNHGTGAPTRVFAICSDGTDLEGTSGATCWGMWSVTVMAALLWLSLSG